MSETVISVEHLSKLYRIGRAPTGHSHRRDAEIAEECVKNLCVLPSTAPYKPGDCAGDLVCVSAVNQRLSMSDVVIQVENLSKLYRIGKARAERRHDTQRDLIADCELLIANLARPPIGPAKGVRRSPRALRGGYRNPHSEIQERLAFAVAAHPEPEILRVDEVLAVGDAASQKKCLGKMGVVAKEERRT